MSRVTQQHSRGYFQLDLTMSCRESMLQLQLQFPAKRGHTCFSSRHMQSWTWRQNQSAQNLNHFCRAPFRISGHFRWPITPLFFGIFLSFFHSMLSFNYFTSMHGKNLKVLCFKTAIWRTLIVFFFPDWRKSMRAHNEKHRKNLHGLRGRRQLPAFCFKRTMFVWEGGGSKLVRLEEKSAFLDCCVWFCMTSRSFGWRRNP